MDPIAGWRNRIVLINLPNNFGDRPPAINKLEETRSHCVHDQRVSVCLLVKNDNKAWTRGSRHRKVRDRRCAVQFGNIIFKTENPKLTIADRYQRLGIKIANCPVARAQAKKKVAARAVARLGVVAFLSHDGNLDLNRLREGKMLD